MLCSLQIPNALSFRISKALQPKIFINQKNEDPRYEKTVICTFRYSNFLRVRY
jgi:hypothetical protein